MEPEIYTQVSIKALKAVHTATHPAKPIRSRLAVAKSGNTAADAGAAGSASDVAEALLATLDAGDDEEAVWVGPPALPGEAGGAGR